MPTAAAISTSLMSSYLIAYIFAGGPAPNPLMTGDANCDGSVDISDAVYLIAYIFTGGPLPVANRFVPNPPVLWPASINQFSRRSAATATITFGTQVQDASRNTIK